jgi:putative two-component system response regulator
MLTTEKPTVLIVDDASDNLMLLKMLLQKNYKVKLALSGEIALIAAEQSPQPELILLDVVMPEMDGYEVCQRLKANPVTADIPILFLTSKNTPEDHRLGFEAGALDYITKPIDPNVLQARVATHVQLKALRKEVRENANRIDQMVEARLAEMTHIQDATILAMAAMVETADNSIQNHILRTQQYVAALARRLQLQDRYANELSDENIALIVKAVPLHDVGKIGGLDPGSRNPGKLDDDEIELMRQHTTFGRESIAGIEKYLGITSPFLQYAREICYSHQERYDGSGYPEGLKGDAIPLTARLMAVANVYDALISERSYREAVSHTQAMAILYEGRGVLFDPYVIDALLEIKGEIQAIVAKFSQL